MKFSKTKRKECFQYIHANRLISGLFNQLGWIASMEIYWRPLNEDAPV